MQLDVGEVIEARKKEIDYIEKKHAWMKVTREEAVRRGWPLKSRWIEVNAGDVSRKNHRSRFMGKELNNRAMDGLSAGIPPLEALRYLTHRAAATDDRTRAEYNI